VEDPDGGDPIRTWRELDEDGQSPWWASIARNKHCIAVNMRHEAGRTYARIGSDRMAP